MLAGVTLITHGWSFPGFDPTGWVVAMQQEVATRVAAGGGQATTARLVVVEDGLWPFSSLRVERHGVTGPSLSASSNSRAELIAALDWNDVNGGSWPTGSVAGAFVQEILSLGLGHALGIQGTSIASLPFHLIGHSRGASVISSIARQLGEKGVVVDHVTLLDSHPISGDEDPVLYENVVFADSFRQEVGVNLFNPHGYPVNGSYDRDVGELAGGYDRNHSDAHLWYHGTIDTEGDAVDGSATLLDFYRDWWYGPGEARGATTGFAWSRLGGLANLRPAAGISGQHGGGGSRHDLVRSGPQWPNVSIAAINDTTPVLGQSIRINYAHQDADSGVWVRFFADSDQNPFNGNVLALTNAFTLPSTGNAPGAFDPIRQSSFSWAVSGLAPRPQPYYIFATITDGPRTRFAYATQRITISTPSLTLGTDRTTVAVGPNGTATVTATVRDPAGAPAANVWVQLQTGTGALGAWLSTASGQTNAQGKFSATFRPDRIQSHPINAGVAGIWKRAVLRGVPRLNAASDFNLDGTPDLLWQQARGSGALSAWLMNGTAFPPGANLNPAEMGAGKRLVGKADFDGDDNPDLLVYDPATRNLACWLMSGTKRTGVAAIPGLSGADWRLHGRVAAVGDFDADGDPDIVWRHGTDGRNLLWTMNGTQPVRAWELPAQTDLHWQVAAASDLNRDGIDDLLWRNGRTAQTAVWLMAFSGGPSLAAGKVISSTPTDVNWQIADAADFSGDTIPDLVWRNTLTGENRLWIMAGADGTSRAEERYLRSGGASWLAAGAKPFKVGVDGDFNGDGHRDLLFRNSSTGQNALWLLRDGAFQSGVLLPSQPDLHWHVAATADFNRDNKTDILWWNDSTRRTVLWALDGIRRVSSTWFRTLDPGWRIQAAADFNGDETTDLLVRQANTGHNEVWTLTGRPEVGGWTSPERMPMSPQFDVSWSAAGAGDFNADGRADIVWNRPDGRAALWLMSGTSPAGSRWLPSVAPGSQRIGVVGDFSGDRASDLVVFDSTTRRVELWRISGFVREGNPMLIAVTASAAWMLVC